MFSAPDLPSVKALIKAHLYNNHTVFALAGLCFFCLKKQNGADFLKFSVKIKNFFDKNALLHKNRQLLCFFDYRLQGLISARQQQKILSNLRRMYDKKGR